MNKETTIEAGPLAKLREPFPPHQISKLPKETKAQIEARRSDKTLMVWKCEECGGAHHKNANHLDYVGHAALTDRLLDTDPHWSWEPLALRDGLPAFDESGGLWIRLTVCGVTRLGYGHAAAKPNQDPGAREKEVIGDALRNAAMRFGAALELWHKGDLHADEEEPPAPRADPAPVRMATDEQRDTIQTVASAANKPVKDICAAYARSTGREIASLKDLTADEADAVIARLQKLTKEPANA